MARVRRWWSGADALGACVCRVGGQHEDCAPSKPAEHVDAWMHDAQLRAQLWETSAKLVGL